MVTMKYVDNLVIAFSKLDPSGKNEFESNGSIYKAKLKKLDDQLRAQLR